MLQAVIPYALVGFGVGSIAKSPVIGAAIGTAVGLTRAEGAKKEIQDAGIGWIPWFMRSDVDVAPKVVTDPKSARLAAAFALQRSGKGKEYGTPADMAKYTRGSGIPWTGVADDPEKVLRKTLKTKLDPRQRGYLIRLLGDLKKRKKDIALPPKSAPIAQRKKKTRPSKIQESKTSFSPLIDQLDPVSSGSTGMERQPWYRTKGGRIGIAALAGTGAILVILLLSRKK